MALQVVTDFRQTGQFVDTSLCHGWAGLVLTTERIAADALPDLRGTMPALRDRLTAETESHPTPEHTGWLTSILACFSRSTPSRPPAPLIRGGRPAYSSLDESDVTVSQTPMADQLRNRLVDAILAERPVPADVERAMRTVPRDTFLPGLGLENAYTDEAVTIKRSFLLVCGRAGCW
ncbi:hypothetical protein FB570_11935 [Streptomyces sp. T12]|uniref:hypothetical protein n=1 Tax=Streptomyces sp. T12 TaxID=477697 RepID=UPI0011A8B8F9|nr:hypothetical protein [Streptomyces sp. T12]TWD13108.1 hypothetical protein FB570_11935 [Streptomyces sp. T12]